MARLSYQEAVIANGAAQSGEVDLRNHRLVAIAMPAAWTAAAITFLGAAPPNDGARVAAEPFQKVQDSAGVETSITAVASVYIVLTEAQRQACAGLARVKVQSGTSGTPVNQGGARTLTLVVEARESNT